MSDTTLAKAFDPKTFEDRIYAYWLDNRVFLPRETGAERFVVVIPPPNVTGVLHIGHGLNNTMQDLLVRYHRMKGERTLWVPGTDHAGIATQNVVERRLKKEGTSRQALGRERFVEETWKVSNEHHATIVRQLQKIGASCDWTRERFTLDEGLSRAVREVFVSLYERGLIYRGNYLVNWCPSCGTALSDEEVEYREVKGTMYRIRYPFAEGQGAIEVATTRPETLFGDSAVGVNPDDARYAAFVGRRVRLPLTARTIEIVADSFVDMAFGTGAVKVTPAHDPNDWELGNRHGLERINILNRDGTLNEVVPEAYRGLAVRAARAKVVEDLKAAGLLVREEDHPHQVGHCYRCATVVEPFLSEQWFVRMKGMAEKAYAAWERGEVRFFPARWENTYTHWLKGIRDWCISRQLWWGHRIPVWYCDACGETLVARADPASCPRCGGALRQEEDVLDTWFSSWLWPFSTLGWPDKTPDLEAFFPTTALVTAYDIIFFWVSRMIMASLEFTGQVPFRDVYITGLVRDTQGRKMSKSLGNGIDPLEIVDQFGADALKFSFAYLSVQGQDILIDRESFRLGSKFANKIWNAARYLLMNAEGRRIEPIEAVALRDLDRWILHRLNQAVRSVERSLDGYRIDAAAQAVYEFFWNDLCDWYIEASKLSLGGAEESERDRSVSVLLHVFDQALRLAHPFLSFITEEIYQRLPGRSGSIALAAYPQARDELDQPDLASRFEELKELVRSARTLRSEFAVPPDRRVRLHVRLDPGFRSADFFKSHRDLVELLVNTDRLDFSEERPDSSGAIPIAGQGFESFVYIRDAVDVPREVAKLRKEAEKLAVLKSGTEKKLADAAFRRHAPAEVVERERGKLAEFSERSAKIAEYVRELEALSSGASGNQSGGERV